MEIESDELAVRHLVAEGLVVGVENTAVLAVLVRDPRKRFENLILSTRERGEHWNSRGVGFQ